MNSNNLFTYIHTMYGYAYYENYNNITPNKIISFYQEKIFMEKIFMTYKFINIIFIYQDEYNLLQDNSEIIYEYSFI